MTTQDLKNNREEVMNFINTMGYDLKFAMQVAVEIAANCDTIEELKIELQPYCTPVKVKSKLAELSASYHESKDERYNFVTKRFEKY